MLEADSKQDSLGMALRTIVQSFMPRLLYSLQLLGEFQFKPLIRDNDGAIYLSHEYF